MFISVEKKIAIAEFAKYKELLDNVKSSDCSITLDYTPDNPTICGIDVPVIFHNTLEGLVKDIVCCAFEDYVNSLVNIHHLNDQELTDIGAFSP